MKHCFYIFSLFFVLHSSLFIQQAEAQSFTSLWKQVKTAEDKDQPKSALAAIEKIERKAEKGQDYGNLLAALMKEMVLQREISPDSLRAAQARLKIRQMKWRENGHGVEAALADLCYVRYANVSWKNDDKQNEQWIDSLLSSPDSALYRKAGKAHEYLPLIVKGEDSRYFNNDLLSLIILTDDKGKKTTDLLEKYYGKDNKVVKWRRLGDAIANEKDAGKAVAMIDKALVEWKDWKEINFIRNIRNELTKPSFDATIAKQVVSTQDDVKLTLKHIRNIGQLNVTLVNGSGDKKKYTHTFNLKNEWEEKESDTLTIGRLPLGKWTVSIADEKGEIKRTTDTLYVTNLKVIEMALPDDKVRVVVVDAKTGAPVDGATVHYTKRLWGTKEQKEQVGITDGNGELVIKKKDANIYGNDYYTYATKGSDTAMPATAVWTSYRSGKAQKVQNHINLYADRAIYRRGQTVHVSVLCHTVMDGKETMVSPREKVTLILRDRKNKAMEEKTVVTDDYGTATADFKIPEEGENGYYSVAGKGSVTSSVSFRVEDYKRPNFEVKLTIDENEKLSTEKTNKDTIIVKGEVKTYSGVPVANAKVVSEVKRTQYFRYGGTILLNDTLYTDADGMFYAHMPMTLPEDIDKKWYYCYHYTLKADVTDDTGESHSESITKKRENDKPQKPETPKAPEAVSASAKNFSENNEPVKITLRNVGADKASKVFAYYTLCASDSVMEKGKIEFNDSTTYTLLYKEEYGDGVTFSVAWVKDGEMVNDNVQVKKYLPSKTLTMEWGTFRNKLYPGQTETWTLKIKNPDGTPSKAQVMAVMYDKSLDALKGNNWILGDYRSLYLPTMGWNTGHIGSTYFYGHKEFKLFKEEKLAFNYIDEDYIRVRRYYALGVSGKSRGLYEVNQKVFDCVESAPMMAMAKTNSSSMPIGSFDVTNDEAVTVGYAGNSAEADVPMRSNFGETAFFLPQVMTDKNGVATLKFTMPESVTTWRFMALAHDKEMRYALMDTTALTQKKVMVQAKMPRFLRVGDKATISASIANLMEKAQKVTVNFIVKDAKTEKVISRESKTVMTEAGRTQGVTFAYDVEKEGDLLCSFSAQVPGFSDGEQHLLPVLTEKEIQADTTAIVVNPRKMLMEALPELQVPKSTNAIALVQAIYANVVSAHLNDTIVSPANDNVLAQLINLQHADGGFAWYNGMQSNRYITIEVLKTLARLNLMCGKQTNTEFMMEKAFKFAEKEMEKEMHEMKKYNVKYLSSTALDWLYTLAISGKDGGAAESFFRKMIYEETKFDDMQTKAVSAITLNENGKKKKASEFVESIKQHTVYRADMGRYFDSYRASYSWCSYRIPTQTMCIEAMQNVTPEDEQTIGEMQRWIVSSKRTQKWDNPINTVNALYALHDVKDTTMLATYTVRPEDIQGALSISRELKTEKLKVGEKVKVKLTIVADRDYDFVTVTDNRPACLEPVNQLSGYRWGAYRGYYAEMRDSKSIYHFDQLAKGKYEIETEYYVSRIGEYQSGNATIVCEYAPEFRGSAEAMKLNVK